MVDINPLDAIKTLLIDNWNDTNTDSITPTIVKKYEHPKDYRLKFNEDIIYIYSITTNLTPSGIGSPTYSDVQETVSIDLRSKPAQGSLTSDSHARKTLYEVQRILKGNINSPFNGFEIIDQEITYNDTSGSFVGIFRYVFTINLKAYCRNIN